MKLAPKENDDIISFAELNKDFQTKLFLVGQNSRSLLMFYVKYMQVYTGIIFESRYIHIQI